MGNPNPDQSGLVYFKKGQSGNPKGKPKGTRNFKTILNEYLDKNVDFKDPVEKRKVKKSLREVVALSLLSKAVKGDLNAISQVMDRVDGKPVQVNKNENSFTDIVIGLPAGMVKNDLE